MIVVFVVDTSPSMGRPAVGESGMSRLDLAKMAVEDLSKQLRKRMFDHQQRILSESQATQRSLMNIGLGNNNNNSDSLLLLSTARQHPDTAACAAGGRLLVGFSETPNQEPSADPTQQQHQQQQHMERFQHELKGLQAAKWDPSSRQPFPDDGGGAVGLNAAVSAGLQLLSRYRLQSRLTENFGMGRLPSPAFMMTANASPATTALQPACLILITDGACLRQSPKMGGGSLQLQYGSQPLREFYKEPFRWDQRVFCLGVGGREGITSAQYLHPQLRALCEVTGGSHWLVRTPSVLSSITENMIKRISPPLSPELPLPDPLYLRLANNNNNISGSPATVVTTTPGSSFVNGGPVCCFQGLENDETGRPPTRLRAMLLYTASPATGDNKILGPPIWCIPEAFFPSKKLDSLPPRPAQPLLYYSKYPSNLGSKSFEPIQLIKMLNRLDQLIAANRKAASLPVKYLHRDVYICEWLSPEAGKPVQVSMGSRQEYFPVFVPGAGRPTLSEDSENYLNIGILHVPSNSSTLAASANASRLATLTMLPPEPHILLPLLIRAAEAEHRLLKKTDNKGTAGTTTGLIPKQGKPMVPLDEHWRSEFRAYLFRLPPYYQHALKRSLRPVVPNSAHSLLHSEPMETMALQCFSKVCMQKIRNGEQIAKDNNERLERQEASLRKRGSLDIRQADDKAPALRYGQYDPRTTPESYLAAIRNMPAPWRVLKASERNKQEETKTPDGKSETASMLSESEVESPKSVVDLLGDLPARCLMAYYESRRRWIFGGTGLTTRGIHVEGVNNGGSNSQSCKTKPSEQEECLLSLAGVGVSMVNQTPAHKMGDYRERLLFSRSPVVGYGSNDYSGVAATTAADGSPRWSVDDDAMPMTFFDPKTGEFADSVQARLRAKLVLTFGNPFKEKRADSLIPENYLSQAPSMQQGGFDSVTGSPRSAPGSPPHDSFESVEEGEAVFVRKSPSRTSPKREEPDEPTILPPAKRPRVDTAVSSGDKALLEKAADTKHLPPTPKTAKPPPPAAKESKQPAAPAPVPKQTPAPPPKPSGGSKQPPPAAPAPAPKQTPAPPPKPSGGSKQPPPPPPPKSVARKAPPPPRPAAPKPSGNAAPPKPPQQAARPPPPKPSAAAPKPAPTGAAPSASQQAEVPHPAALGQQQRKPSLTIPTSQDLQRPDVKPKVDLPPGWMCVWSKSQKRWYFFNKKTNQSVWEWPPPSS